MAQLLAEALSRAGLLFVPFIALLFISGCVLSRAPLADVSPYECLPGGPNDPDTRLRPTAPPVVKIIQLTDEGELVNRCQWTDALYELNYTDQPQVVVMYVHGWKHEPSQGDEDRKQFELFIDRLTKRERDSTSPRQVVGIFVGWQGLSTNIPVVRELTFWDRQQVADRISQSAIITKLVGAIDNIIHKRADPNNLVVFIGHSFGARILFTATSQLLLYNVQMQHPRMRGGSYGLIRAPADLIVLLNPAVEASTYTALDTLRRYQERFSIDQAPLLLTISTTNDWATGTAFPIGKRIGFSRHERQLTTLGNYDNYVTHSLLRNPVGRQFSVDRQWTAIKDFSPWYDSFCRFGICLTRQVHDRQPGNPFLVARTNKEVLDGHNGIWGNTFIAWLESFMYEVDYRNTKSH